MSEVSGSEHGQANVPLIPAAVRLGIRGGLLRAVLVITFLIGAELVTLGVVLAVGTYSLGTACICGAVGVVLLLGSMFLLARQLRRFAGTVLVPRFVLLIFISLSAAASLACFVLYESMSRTASEGGMFLAALVAIILGVLYLGRISARFVLGGGIVAIAILAALFVIQYRAIPTAIASAIQQRRVAKFKDMVAKLEGLTDTPECRKMWSEMQPTTKRFGNMPDPEGKVIVVGYWKWRSGEAFVHGPMISEGFLAPKLLARTPSDVGLVAILGGVHASRPGNDAPLVVSVVVFSWPEKKAVLTATMDIGCRVGNRGWQIFPATALALSELLQEQAAAN